jgi:hypothetical protein
MRSGLAWIRAAIGTAMIAGTATTASAQAALDDDDDMPAPEPAAADYADPNATRIGVGLRVRNVMVPQGLIELFVERAAGGSSELGLGFEISRRRGSFEVQFGVEWDNIQVERGIWIDKGDTLPIDEADDVTFDHDGYFAWGTFGWVTAEVTFLNHSEIIKQLAIRYGGGAGIGIVRGEVRRTDVRCTGTNENPGVCMEVPGAENVNNPYDIPPVMLIVNAIIGVQIRPIDNLFINIEGGIRTVPFFGMTAGYYF